MNKKYLIIASVIAVLVISLSIFLWKSLNSENFNDYPTYKKILDQMNENFNKSQPTDLSLNGKNYKDLPNVTPQPATKFVQPKGGSDFVLKGKDGKEYLMPMWTFVSAMDNADKNAEKNQSRTDFLASLVSENNNKFTKFAMMAEPAIEENNSKFTKFARMAEPAIEEINNKFVKFEKVVEKKLAENNNGFTKFADAAEQAIEKTNNMLTESVKGLIKKIGDTQQRLNTVENDVSDTKVMVKNINSNMKNMFSELNNKMSSMNNTVSVVEFPSDGNRMAKKPANYVASKVAPLYR